MAPTPVGYVNFWWLQNLIRISYVTTLYEPPFTYRMGEISGGQTVVTGGRLVGTVPDATDSVTLLGLALCSLVGVQLTLRRRTDRMTRV